MEPLKQAKVDNCLFAVLRVLNSGQSLPDVLNFIVVRASEMMGGETAVSIRRFDHDKHLSILEAEHLLAPALRDIAVVSLGASQSAAASKRAPIVLPNLTHAVLEFENQNRFEALLAHYKSYLAVPLIVRDVVIGEMAFYFPHKRTIATDDVNGAKTLAEQAALAIENARLHEAEQMRQRELQTLLDVTEAASSSLHLEETLDAAVNRLLRLVESERIGVVIFDDHHENMVFRKVYPSRFVSEAEWNHLMPIGQHVIKQGKSLYFAPHSAPGVADEPMAIVPVQARGRTFGVLGIVGHPNQQFTSQQLVLFDSVGAQLGSAVDHARLTEQAEAAAITQERNRLARDLHDAVTQTLFSASLIADVLPRIWEKNPEQGVARLDELKELTRGALAEMRSLLLELRPATLTESSLSELLRQLTDAVVGRSRIPIELAVGGVERPLPPDIQVALYRIAQESLNNIVKHAQAEHIKIDVQFDTEFVKFSVEDDGRGFVLQEVGNNSMGLGIMQERAEKIGATLTIKTNVGGGTTIYVICPIKSET